MMYRFLTIFVLVLGISLGNAWGQPRSARGRFFRPPAARSVKSAGQLMVSIVPVIGGPSFAGVPNGLSSLSIGAVSSGTGARTAGVAVVRLQHSMVVRASFGLKVENAGAQQGTATLSAFLFQPNARYNIFLDGVELSVTPRLIEGKAVYGTPSPHRLEIEIPNSLPENQGHIVSNVGFIAVPN